MPYRDPERQREYQRQWIAARRGVFFEDKSCIECGGTEQLNVHHRDPSKKISHKIWSWAQERRLAELKKCDVLCEKCHQRLHNPRRVQHGSLTMYKCHGCRCEQCRAASWAYEKKRRGRKAQTAGL